MINCITNCNISFQFFYILQNQTDSPWNITLWTIHHKYAYQTSGSFLEHSTSDNSLYTCSSNIRRSAEVHHALLFTEYQMSHIKSFNGNQL